MPIVPMWVGLRKIGRTDRQAPPCAHHGDVAGLLWLAAAALADAQCVVVAVAGCLDGVSARVSVKERNDLDHFPCRAA